MTELIVLIALIILAETSYLTYRSTRTTKIKYDSILLDTSVLIDGRILSIARSGLMTSPLVVPKSVMHELQFMADKADHNKRERARFGLEVIEKLQEIETTDLTIIDDGATDVHGVDEQLIVLAKRYGARLCTIDYNLNKVARVQSVIVVNINELAHALRIVHLPGETVEVKLVQVGQEKKQAVGYLDDGTMTVVDDARDLVGKVVEINITRALQTAAGNMLFAKLVSKKPKVPAREPAPVTQQPKQLPKPPKPERAPQKQQPRRNPRQQQPGTPRRRQDIEDSLIELANKE